jgi:hypothetical protein
MSRALYRPYAKDMKHEDHVRRRLSTLLSRRGPQALPELQAQRAKPDRCNGSRAHCDSKSHLDFAYGTSEVTVDSFIVGPLAAMVNGDEVSPNFQNLIVDYSGHVHSDLESPGSNWAGYLGAVGEVEVPYTIELDVTYSPVPEPSSFLLIGTGIFGLVGLARHKFSFA